MYILLVGGGGGGGGGGVLSSESMVCHWNKQVPLMSCMVHVCAYIEFHHASSVLITSCGIFTINLLVEYIVLISTPHSLTQAFCWKANSSQKLQKHTGTYNISYIIWLTVHVQHNYYYDIVWCIAKSCVICIPYIHAQSEFADTTAYTEVKKSLEVSHKSRLKHYFRVQCT